MDFESTEGQKALVTMIKDFFRRETSPEFWLDLVARDPMERMPWDLMKKLHDVGLATLAVPKNWGGEGVDLFTLMLAAEALGQYAPPLFPIYQHDWRTCVILNEVGTEEQQDEIFTRIMSEPTFYMGSSTTEPDYGHDPLLPYDEPGEGMKTFAYREGDEYVINGQKCFSCGVDADILWLSLRTDKHKPLSQSMSTLLVPKGTPGCSVRINEWLVEHLRPNGDIIFDNARVPARYLLGGEENTGFAMLRNHPRAAASIFLWLAAQIGTSQAIYELTLEYANTRIQGGKPIIEHPTIGVKMVEMLTKIEQTRLLLYKALWEIEQAAKVGSLPASPLGFNLLNAMVHDLHAFVALSAMDVLAGRAVMKDTYIEWLIRYVLEDLHGSGTATFNRIKASQLLYRE